MDYSFRRFFGLLVSVAVFFGLLVYVVEWLLFR